MKQENIDFLEATKHHYDTIINANYVRGLNVHEREGLLRVMHQEFYPNYVTDMNCTPCIFDFIKLIYRLYDDWKAKQPKEVITEKEFSEMTDKAIDEVIPEIKATFPSHKEEIITDRGAEANKFAESESLTNKHNKKNHQRK